MAEKLTPAKIEEAAKHYENITSGKTPILEKDKGLLKEPNIKDMHEYLKKKDPASYPLIPPTDPRLLMKIAPYTDDMLKEFKIEDRKAGLRLITSPWKRPAPDTAPFEAKASGPYIICTMSKEFAESKGYHDALMLDYRGYVAEGTGANIFFIKDNEIHTPIPDCFLNGITRQTVIEMLSNQGFEIIERHIEPNEIANYEEAFLKEKDFLNTVYN